MTGTLPFDYEQSVDQLVTELQIPEDSIVADEFKESANVKTINSKSIENGFL